MRLFDHSYNTLNALSVLQNGKMQQNLHLDTAVLPGSSWAPASHSCPPPTWLSPPQASCHNRHVDRVQWSRQDDIIVDVKDSLAVIGWYFCLHPGNSTSQGYPYRFGGGGDPWG